MLVGVGNEWRRLGAGLYRLLSMLPKNVGTDGVPSAEIEDREKERQSQLKIAKGASNGAGPPTLEQDVALRGVPNIHCTGVRTYIGRGVLAIFTCHTGVGTTV